MTDWEKELLTKYKHLKMEFSQSFDSMNAFKSLFRSGDIKPSFIIYLPHRPDATTMRAIRELIPREIDYKYVEFIKPSVMESLKAELAQEGIGSVQIKQEGRHVMFRVLSIPGKEIEPHSSFWGIISKELYDDGFYDTWEIKAGEESRSYNRAVMNEVASRVVGDDPITESDITDLSIMLNTCKTVDDFLAQIGA